MGIYHQYFFRALFIMSINACTHILTYTPIHTQHSYNKMLLHAVEKICIYDLTNKLQLNTGTYTRTLLLNLNKGPHNTPKEKFMCQIFKYSNYINDRIKFPMPNVNNMVQQTCSIHVFQFIAMKPTGTWIHVHQVKLQPVLFIGLLDTNTHHRILHFRGNDHLKYWERCRQNTFKML